MANINRMTGDPINMGNDDILNYMATARLAGASSTAFSVTSPDGGVIYNFSGTFTAFGTNGMPTAGHVTGVDFIFSQGGMYDPYGGGGYGYGGGGMTPGTQTTSLVMNGMDVDVGLFFAPASPANTAALWSAIGAGDDNITAGPGTSNNILGFAGADSIAGSSGDDTLDGGNGNDSIDGGAGQDTITGGDGNDSIRGLDGNDTISGGLGDDDVNGNKGDDVVHGDDGSDFVRGGQGNDQVFGDAGDDVHVNGNIGDDTVHGGEGNDTVFGGQGNDLVFGDNGDDLLSGDLGDDTLTGGAGADRFAFRVGSGHDVVTDFNAAEGDQIQLPVGTAFTLSTVNGNAVVDLGGGDTLTLNGVSQANSGWIVFA